MENIEEFLTKLKELINEKSDYKYKTIPGKLYMRGGNILNKPIVFGCYFSPENKSISINLESQVKVDLLLLMSYIKLKMMK